VKYPLSWCIQPCEVYCGNFEEEEQTFILQMIVTSVLSMNLLSWQCYWSQCTEGEAEMTGHHWRVVASVTRNFGILTIAAHLIYIMSFEIHVTKTQWSAHTSCRNCIFDKSKCYKFTCSCVLWRNEFSSLFSVAQRSLLAVSRLSPVTILRAENKCRNSFQTEVKFRVSLWWCVRIGKIN
jgi:hypothetical protein